MASDTISFDFDKMNETADRCEAGAKNLPDNFMKVYETFKKYADVSNSEGMINRAEMTRDIADALLKPACENLTKLAKALREKADEMRSGDK